ncbi:hypothetical protein FEV53_04115 [Palleronia caenipelagi]|uniref:DUF3617 family protein n=2 Tax=Palleronia caenipelagi TaxID=2489174 RepID=A0A547Q8A2_9RHOB|nr:hypothetical protein FEV53_04115 [Palleronia caenipelagi]
MAAAPAFAQEVNVSVFEGLWRASPTQQCVYEANSLESALRIADSRIDGVDTTCRMTNPFDVRDMDAVLFDLVCESVEGEFTERAMFVQAADGGLIVVWSGYAYKYERCDADAAEGTVVTSDQVGIPDQVEPSNAPVSTDSTPDAEPSDTDSTKLAD